MQKMGDLGVWDRCQRILDWLRTQPGGATKKEIGRFIRIGYKPINETIEALLEKGSIEPCEISVGRSKRKFNGYRVSQHIG